MLQYFAIEKMSIDEKQLQKRLAVLQGFQGQPDPTIRHAGQASAPAAESAESDGHW